MTCPPAVYLSNLEPVLGHVGLDLGLLQLGLCHLKPHNCDIVSLTYCSSRCSALDLLEINRLWKCNFHIIPCFRKLVGRSDGLSQFSRKVGS